MVEITMKSEMSGKMHTRDIPVDVDKLAAWRASGNRAPLIQNAFPELSDDDREFLMTGITPEEWDEMFEGMDDE